MKQIHYFYKITNLINKKFYYGIRSCYCLPGKDPYMGSGRSLHRAFRKYGIENFRKEVLRICKTREDLKDLERWIVTDDLVKNSNCYNQCLGGGESTAFEGVTVIIDEKYSIISIDEYRRNKDLYVTPETGKVKVYDTVDNVYKDISKEKYYNEKSTGRYITTFLKYNKSIGHGTSKGKVSVKDCYGNYTLVSKNDPRYLSGELVPIWKGRSHSEITKDKMSKSHQITSKGERNSHYGTKWMISPEGISKPIKEDLVDEYLSNGWILGRKMTIKKASQKPLEP